MNMRQEKKRRVFRKYYFQEKSTLIVAFFFITLCIVIFLQQIPFFSIKNVFSPEKSVALIVWELATGKYNFLILAVILRFYFSFKSRIDKTIKSFEQNEEEGKDDGNFIIRMSDGNTMPRNESWEKIKEVFERAFDNRKHVFFVGKSGSGKSLLLRTYLSEYEKWEKGKKDSKVNIFSTSDKNADIVYRPIGGNKTDLLTILDRYKRSNIRQLIIFDQFEKLILPRYKDAFSCITKFLSDNSGNTAISVVFVCTNEEYINVLKKLEKKPEDYENYFPEIELNDKDSMLDRIKGDCGIKEGNERYKFFVNELADPKNVSMIEINAAKKYFQIEKEREVYINVLSDKAGKGKTEKDTMELIFKYHLERMLARLETPELAMITLYALCCANGLLNRRDFQNITFAPEETVTTILESLKSQEIIELTHDEDKDSPYILSHEYLIEKLTSCCNENLSAQIMVNIEFYCNKINKLMESGGEATEEVSVYYKHTINEDKSSNLIRTFMKVLCAMIVGVCVWYVIKDFDTRDFFLNFALFNFVIKYDFFSIYEMDPNILALAVLAMGGAIFYIYHYLFYFAKIFLSKKSPEFMICVLVLVWGIISVLLSLIINWLWPTWLGIEWILVAILHLVLAKKTSLNRQAADRLKGEGTFYIVVAFLLIGANFALILIEGLGRVVMEFWFVIFFVLFLLIIRQHINTDYMLAKLSSFTEDDS